ncbi:uncharacterized protein VICG_01722 [Vittaforma corneae ATCC 50505]|uniref:Uncharacterized protein n=1 Tax=Vittaforma corneae (strain ATCC 50505) TaxID=993615 RepID=L2GK23_VITCO|nr:uncharacterized protein VICG_01722 [Vittaforma corneae ATCC 50505]ELA41233.1 hypothetical protein VICG_01722 [Vittaforma corneae ATCC 50505]
MIILVSLFCSILIIGIGMLARSTTGDSPESSNEDLNKFYGMFAEPMSVQMKQLILAAKNTLKKLNVLAEEREVVSNLFEERVLSDEFFKRFRNAEEELVIEKTLIENEAEALRTGSKDQVFSEASKLLSVEILGTKKKRIFDEALFLKKQENLMKDLKSRSKK